jgi:acid phosphatase family membrane protein YuiD
MDYQYLITPFLAWLIAGGLKFLINSWRARRLAFGLIGYGGLPSNHSAIVSSMTALIAFREGIATPVFGVSITLAFIVILDAASLRKQIGSQAVVINQLVKHSGLDKSQVRERIGHSKLEIVAGIVVGCVVAACVNWGLSSGPTS